MPHCNPLSFSIGALLQPFTCIGCETLQFRPLCDFCRRQWVAPHLPFQEIVAIGPLYALWFGNTIAYRAFRQWKLTGSKRIEGQLFQFHPTLLSHLRAENFQAVVPIPQDLRRSWNRGFESAAVAGQFFSKVLGIPMLRALELDVTIARNQQAMRDRMDRDLSANPFRVRHGVEIPSRILVVDDVVTTGATLQHAGDTLAALGLEKVGIAALMYKPPTQKKIARRNYSSFACK